jgi:hypothetical protein
MTITSLTSMIATSKDKPVLVRFPKPVLRQLDAAAKVSGRSRNSEILALVIGGLRRSPARMK